jgi:hypothetical protein
MANYRQGDTLIALLSMRTIQPLLVEDDDVVFPLFVLTLVKVPTMCSKNECSIVITA